MEEGGLPTKDRITYEKFRSICFRTLRIAIAIRMVQIAGDVRLHRRLLLGHLRFLLPRTLKLSSLLDTSRRRRSRCL